MTRIAPRRWLVQIVLLAGLVVTPFVSLGGNPFLRIDIGLRTFFMAGVPIRIDQFYLVLLLTLAGVAGFLLMTVLLGRVWCGWLCPQTVLNDLAELCSEKLHRLFSPAIAGFVRHTLVALLSMAISVILLSWFQSPAAVAGNLLDPFSHPVVFTAFVLLTLLLYLDMILVGRCFCSKYCPYGRFQTALMDGGTLNLAFLEDTRGRCLNCSSCVRACPMGIDIREGFQIECINCGRCIDACRDVMQRRDMRAGLIAYRFGSGKGAVPRFGAKAAILAALTVIIFTAVGWSLISRNDTAFSVQRNASAEIRVLPDGSQIQAWRAVIGNRGMKEEVYSIDISTPLPGVKTELLGPVTDIRIAPNQNQQVGFSMRFSTVPAAGQAMALRLSKSGAAAAIIRITP